MKVSGEGHSDQVKTQQMPGGREGMSYVGAWGKGALGILRYRNEVSVARAK